ncbi:MAG: hypothetical protein FWD19_00160, partial [Defluviitaleaceae bacterium]|nr:hypothetical protein [Defluviitaleaceae bacterium]
MKKLNFFVAIFLTCILSATAGILLGYFILGPLGVSATAKELSLDKPASVIFELPEEKEKIPDANFIVTAEDGVIVVYANGSAEIIETSFTPINTLPPEDQERLAN